MNEQLLIRFLTRRCTPGEMAEVEQWAALDADNAAWLFEMERVWSMKNQLRFSNEERIGAAYRRFVATRQPSFAPPAQEAASPLPRIPDRRLGCRPAKKQFLLRWTRWAGYAAAVVLITLLGLHLHQMRRPLPEGMNCIEVPAGQKASLTLSDGTRVWLNAGSRFSYPAAFTAADRQVSLEGEGFFEVAHNARSPFRVHTSSMEIKVLGTKFNLKAYRDEISRLTLTEGAVEVTAPQGEKLTLKPNDEARYSARGGLTLIEKVDPALASGWMQGELVFTRECLADIARELERKFDVAIRIDDASLGEEYFNCRVRPGVSALQVLDLLKKTRGMDYRLQNDTIRIFKN